MNKTNELPEDVKRLLLNLESNSQQVVAEAIKSLEKIGNTDPKVITTLRKLAGEKTNWYIQTTGSAFKLANKLSQQAEKEDLQRLNDFIKNNELPDRDLLLRILQFQKEGSMMKPEGNYIPRPWVNKVSGVYWLAIGMYWFSNMLLKLQEQNPDSEPSAWSLLLSLILAIVFYLGWRFGPYIEKFNPSLSEKWDFIISIVFFPALAIIVLFLVLLKPSVLSIQMFTACGALLLSGLMFNRVSTQRKQDD